MKTIAALTLGIVLCAGLASAAFAHGWQHGRDGHGRHAGWDMRADGYGQRHNGGPCWEDRGADGPRHRYERQDGYGDDARYRERGAKTYNEYRRDGYRDEGMGR